MKRQRETEISGIVHQESDNAPLELLSGLQIAGITYLEKEPNELKLVSASNADVGLLSHRIAAGYFIEMPTRRTYSFKLARR